MIEFLSHRYGIEPWILENARVPYGSLMKWAGIAMENATEEGAAGLLKVLDGLLK